MAEQGYLAPLDHGAGSFCRCLYALALMFPPKLSSHNSNATQLSAQACSQKWALLESQPLHQNFLALAAAQNAPPFAKHRSYGVWYPQFLWP